VCAFEEQEEGEEEEEDVRKEKSGIYTAQEREWDCGLDHHHPIHPHGATPALQVGTGISRLRAETGARTHHGRGRGRSNGAAATTSSASTTASAACHAAGYGEVGVRGVGFEDYVFLS
jgi:hypothetical protein